MKHLPWIAAIAFVALAGPAPAAELQILAPADRSIIRGTVTFRIKPEHGPRDRFLLNPEISIQDEYGTELERFRAGRDLKAGICTAAFDTTRYKDGAYFATITYRTLGEKQVPDETREDLTLAIRNTSVRPYRAVVDLEDKPYTAGELCDFTVKVYDGRGRLMPGARVAFKVDRGEVNSEAEITDSSGEANAGVQVEEAGTVTLTIQVEDVKPITRVVRFAAAKQ